MVHTSSLKGFTLIQLSILLTVAALVLVTVLPSAQNALVADNASMAKMNSVLLALRQYEAVNGYLPCPADASQPIGSTSYGVAAANPGTGSNCSGGTPAANFSDSTNHVAIGMVPVRALNLSNDYALDAFGRDITYGVDTNATTCIGSVPLAGQIIVGDNGASYNSVAALLSAGADGFGAWLPRTGSSGSASKFNNGSTDTDQVINAHWNMGTNSRGTDLAGSTVTFVKKAATSTFDDLVVYKNPNWNLSAVPQSVTTQQPTLTSPASGNYSPGQQLTFTLTFNSNVTVTGTPRLDMAAITGSIGTSNVAYATYTGGNGTNTLTFAYTVKSTDMAPSGIYLTQSYVDLNGGSISGCPITFTLPNLSGVIIGEILVVDQNNNRIQVFNMAGTFLFGIGAGYNGVSGTIGSSGSLAGQFIQPQGVAVDASQNIWVVDNGNSRLEEFSSTGTYIKSVTTGDIYGDSFSHPSYIAFDTTGNMWVTDTYNGRIDELSSTGAAIATLGQGDFTFVLGIKFDPNGNLWVTDSGGSNCKLDYFDSSHTLHQFGSCEPANVVVNGEYRTNYGIGTLAFSPIDGTMWVEDAGNNRIEQFSTPVTSYNYVTSIGTGYNGVGGTKGYNSNGNGQMFYPLGIAIDSAGYIWEADLGNNRIQQLTPGGAFVMGIGAGYNNVSGTIGQSGTANGQFNGPSDIFLTR